MSRTLAPQLPQDLYLRLSAAHRRPGRAIVVQTMDEQGWPHPALLSEFEILAAAPDRLRLAVMRESKTAANIRDRSRVTLAFIEPESVYYVKAEKVAEKHREGPAALFDLAVVTVLADEVREEETGSRLVSGLLFVAGEKAMSYFKQVFEALKE